MNDEKHIDRETMSLYVSGYPFLKQTVIDFVQAHLRQCDTCRTEYAKELAEFSVLPPCRPETKSFPSMNLLKSVVSFIQQQINLPEAKKQVQDALSRVADVLLQYLEEAQEGSDLAMEGYGFPLPPQGGESEDVETGQKTPEDQLAGSMDFIFRVLASDRIPIAQRIELSNQLMKVIRRFEHDLEEEEGITPPQ